MGNVIWPLFLIVGSNIVYQLSSLDVAKNVNPFAALVVGCIRNRDGCVACALLRHREGFL